MMVVLVVGWALTIKLIGGFLLAGTAGLTLFGASYRGMARTGFDAMHLAHTAAASAHIVGSHVWALVLIFALPLAAGIVALVSRRESEDEPLRSLALLTFCLIGTLAPMAAIFTAAVAEQGPYENVLRVHARYYSFTFPLLIMLAAAQVGRRHHRNRVRLIVGAVLAVGIIFATTTGLAGLDLHLVDGPEVFTAAAHAATRRLTGFVALVALGLWCAKPRAGALVFLFLLTPWLALRGNREALDLFNTHRVATIFEIAGAEAQKIVPVGERVQVATNEVAGAYRAMFQLDRPNSSFVILKPDDVLRVTLVDKGQWLLVVPGRSVGGTAASIRTFNGFDLVRR